MSEKLEEPRMQKLCLDQKKPYKGRISGWTRLEGWNSSNSSKTFVRGRFVDHPVYAREVGHTSWIEKILFNQAEGNYEIETRNSRYTLLGTGNISGIAPTVLADEEEYDETPTKIPTMELHRALGNSIAQATAPEHFGDVSKFIYGEQETRETMAEYGQEYAELVAQAFAAMTYFSHGNSLTCGWHSNPNREPGTMIALMHSELSEALEGIRKDKMDDHLPQYKSVVVELADLLHRVFDFAGKYDLDLAAAYIEKGLYNLQREDHKAEVRAAEGGKRF